MCMSPAVTGVSQELCAKANEPRTLSGTKHELVVLAAEVARSGEVDGYLGDVRVSQRQPSGVFDQVEFPELRRRLQGVSVTNCFYYWAQTHLVFVADQSHLVITSQSDITYIVQNGDTAAKTSKTKHRRVSQTRADFSISFFSRLKAK